MSAQNDRLRGNLCVIDAKNIIKYRIYITIYNIRAAHTMRPRLNAHGFDVWVVVVVALLVYVINTSMRVSYL